MSLPAIRDEHRVPARPGARVTVTGGLMPGSITGSWEDMVRVKFDGDPHTHLLRPEALTFHPTTEEN